MNEEIALVKNLSCFCKKAYCGSIDLPSVDKMVDAAIIQSVNESEDPDCEELPIDAYKKIVCPPNINIRPKYPLDVGEEIPPIPEGDMIYGFYWFEDNPRNPDVPTTVDLAADIAQHPSHYTVDNWIQGMQIAIDSSITTTCYHVIQVDVNFKPINITDEGGGVVNNDWTVLSDSTHTYYLFDHAVAAGTVTYILTQHV